MDVLSLEKIKEEKEAALVAGQAAPHAPKEAHTHVKLHAPGQPAAPSLPHAAPSLPHAPPWAGGCSEEGSLAARGTVQVAKISYELDGA